MSKKDHAAPGSENAAAKLQTPVMTKKRQTLLIYMSALSAGVLLISNLCAAKIWLLKTPFFELPVDGGVVIFPISYVLGDLIVEFFGRRTSRHVIWASFLLSVLATITFWAVDALPALDPTSGEAFNLILGSVPRIIAGSLAAYVASQLLNNLVFEKIKQRTGTKWLAVRSLGSSLAAHVVDTLLFDTIAFAGTMPFADFLRLIAGAYLLAVTFEFILTPLTYLAVDLIRKAMGEPTLGEAIRDCK